MENWIILAQIDCKLLHREAKFPTILSQKGKNYYESHIYNTRREYPRMHIRFLLIPAQICDELSWVMGEGQGHMSYRTSCAKSWIKNI